MGARTLALLRLAAPEVHPQSLGQPPLPLASRISAPGAFAHRPLSSRALRRFKGIPKGFCDAAVLETQPRGGGRRAATQEKAVNPPLKRESFSG